MKKNIRSQIMQGYNIILLVPILMTVVTMVFAFGIINRVGVLSIQHGNQNTTKDAVVGHYSWLNQLSDSIVEGAEFKGSLDPASCVLGKWMASVPPEERADAAIAQALTQLTEPHNYIHNEAKKILELSKTDSNAAYARYSAEILPRVKEIIGDITVVTNRYQEMAAITDQQGQAMVLALLIVSAAMAVLGVVGAYIIGNTQAKRIARPVIDVSNWARQLSLGDSGYDPHEEFQNLNLHPDNEISQMVTAFQTMADGVANNVRVVKRVADGDLTAYVDIRSNEDVLGQSLYRMVQNNDQMFARIFDISGSVTGSAYEISKSSAKLAHTASEQAATIEEISSAVSYINGLSKQNAEFAGQVYRSFAQMQGDVNTSSQKMEELVTAVQEIQAASGQIGKIIKTIDDISFQTNILALNAAIEAARAGEAGKGFAVVADEVRQLALKSAVAAKDTKTLIDNNINKTRDGAALAADTSATFVQIANRITETGGVVRQIDEASQKQCQSIGEVETNMLGVADAQSNTAAFSEESAASSEQLRRFAEVLRTDLKHFNLRQREIGKPYIPEEKKNDLAFIREATENYQRALHKQEQMEKKLSFTD